MICEYMQMGNFSFTAWKKVKEEIEATIEKRMGRCECDPLNIAVEADEQRFHYAARVTCACGNSKDFGDIEGVIIDE